MANGNRLNRLRVRGNTLRPHCLRSWVVNTMDVTHLQFFMYVWGLSFGFHFLGSVVVWFMAPGRAFRAVLNAR